MPTELLVTACFFLYGLVIYLAYSMEKRKEGTRSNSMLLLQAAGLGAQLTLSDVLWRQVPESMIDGHNYGVAIAILIIAGIAVIVALGVGIVLAPKITGEARGKRLQRG